jgi:hypothetical protein
MGLGQIGRLHAKVSRMTAQAFRSICEVQTGCARRAAPYEGQGRAGAMSMVNTRPAPPRPQSWISLETRRQLMAI